MKLNIRQAAALALVAAAASSAFAQITVTGDGTEMPDLKACLANADKGDTAAIDKCVRANLDEIEAFIADNPKTAIDTDTQDEDEADEAE